MSIKEPDAPFALYQLWYPSNLLSLGRLMSLIPALIYLRRPDGHWQAGTIVGTAMLTDAIDGRIARWRGETTRIGEIIDALADKTMLNVLAVALTQTRGFPRWMMRLILLRDAAILLGALLIYLRRGSFPKARSAGRATTATMTVTMLLYIVDGPRSGQPALYVALLPFGASIVDYIPYFVGHLSV
ncbi:MAG: CDP-alcohol phosphatidyltransferase family protein [Chloroflexaceae bacterium]|nr:CDP-alcohol phosphatidyltransferase family protein [Chloroflexaceae bacterium]